MNTDGKTFVMYVAIRKQKEKAIDLDTKAQIEAQIEAQRGAQSGAHSGAQSGAQVGAIIFDKAPTEVPTEYSNYSDVFSAENAAELLKHIEINDYAIKLEKNK